MARKRRKFTPEFKAEAVRLCRVGDRSIGQVAQDLDLTETALREWVQRADVDEGKGPTDALTTSERAEVRQIAQNHLPEIRRMHEEMRVLKMQAQRAA